MLLIHTTTERLQDWKAKICSMSHFESFQNHTVPREEKETSSKQHIKMILISKRLKAQKLCLHYPWTSGRKTQTSATCADMQVLGRQSCCFYTVGNTPRRLYKERSITTYQRRALGINPHKRNKLKTCILKRHTQPVTASTNLSEVEADRKF